MFDFLGWLVFGLIVGALARFLVPGPDRLGCLGTIALGVGGSVVGGWLGWLLFPEAHYRPAGFLGALVGAVLVLWVYRRFMGPRPPTW
jgi:uncharacterized membrane protein YeaQ/YmgE (transglycosylase-associated protein family)